MRSQNIEKGRDVEIHPSARLLAKELSIGDFTKIGENVVIAGGHVEIGREAWITTGVLIGGGRSEMGSLKTGDFLHLGKGSMINTANKVEIGHEVGIGMEGKVFTHGAYLSQYDGFPYQDGPVKIGSNVWLPYAIVNPNVTIGNNVVVAAMSLVNNDVPAGSLAGGIPARILKKNAYPRQIPNNERIGIVDRILAEVEWYGIRAERDEEGRTIFLRKTAFALPERRIEGPADNETERLKDILRRHGIRFRFYCEEREYRPWD